jgi:hypothetical protein
VSSEKIGLRRPHFDSSAVFTPTLTTNSFISLLAAGRYPNGDGDPRKLPSIQLPTLARNGEGDGCKRRDNGQLRVKDRRERYM